DDQPALRGRLHDRAARRAAGPSRARSGHRLRLPGRHSVRLAREVISVERYRTLADTARQRLATLGYDNVDVRVGDGLAGVPEGAPYDRIMVTAAAETIPDALLDELVDGGVMVLPLGPHAGPQQLVKLIKGEQGIKQEDLIGVRFVPLLPGKAREL